MNCKFVSNTAQTKQILLSFQIKKKEEEKQQSVLPHHFAYMTKPA